MRLQTHFHISWTQMSFKSTINVLFHISNSYSSSHKYTHSMRNAQVEKHITTILCISNNVGHTKNFDYLVRKQSYEQELLENYLFFCVHITLNLYVIQKSQSPIMNSDLKFSWKINETLETKMWTIMTTNVLQLEMNLQTHIQKNRRDFANILWNALKSFNNDEWQISMIIWSNSPKSVAYVTWIWV